jgi:hypothetical protein
MPIVPAATGKLLATLSTLILATGLTVAPVPSSAQTATSTATTTAKPKKPPSPGQVALRERQKKCGAEWKEAKAAGKIEKGMKWPKFWSACNKRLKSAT